MFHYNGVLSNGNIGLNIAGNCGGCQWDAVDIAGNHENVLIDQSVAGIQNRQIRFGPLFASDRARAALPITASRSPIPVILALVPVLAASFSVRVVGFPPLRQ